MVALLKSIVLLALASVSVADMHMNAICANPVKNGFVYHGDATTKACQAYKTRNTGRNKWDHCRDCYMNTATPNHHCRSDSWSVGGVEWESYCQLYGAKRGLAK
ncbi:hypothetical protein DSL72_006590 [Monilinia vaccinii-corymbosi]|uniref:Uncharacterized protein n=1 Tax=Monilinia vaccinii-corymbosi TaxID=61207 RepID=A0A8A3PML2_9HELO|nr:hypothetical protein DSL72_006590 [Monilinia vaccinii-corymbosi]